MDPRESNMRPRRTVAWIRNSDFGVPNKISISRLEEIPVESYEMHPKSYFHQQVKVFLVLFRLLGAFPARFSPTEVSLFGLFSPVSVYSILIYLFIGAPTFLLICEHCTELRRTNNFTDDINIVITIALLTTMLYFPLLSWFDLRSSVNHLNEWAQFQMLFLKVTNEDLDLKLRRSSIISLTLSFMLSLTCVFLHYYPPYLEWWKIAVYMFSGVAFGTVLIYKRFMIYSLQSTGIKLNKCFKKDLKERGPTPELIAKYRCLWLQWSQLVSQEGHVMGTLYGFILLLSLFLHVSSLYTFLVGFRSDEISILGQINRFAPSVGSICTLYVVCNGGHRISVMGAEIKKHLQLIAPIYSTQEVMAEVNAFLSVIAMNPPSASVMGFTTMDRTLFTSFMSATVTYMIVLLQFDKGETKGNAPNSTSSPVH